MRIIHSGFDGLDIAIQLKTPIELAEALEDAQSLARERKKDVEITYNGLPLAVAESGARGGYAFRIDTGITGETWFFKRPTDGADHWGIKVSFKGVALALYGLDGAENTIKETLAMLGLPPPSPFMISIGRVDYAIDILAPDFVLNPDCFVMHSRMGIKTYRKGQGINDKAVQIPIEELSTHGRSGRTESVTIGKMPGKQLQIYDKRAEVIQKRKVYWPEIWNQNLEATGLPPLDLKDPATSRVWRVEFRAGKTALKSQFDITTFNDLHDRLPCAFRNMSENIRLTIPSSDTNRARWPTHPLYELAQKEIDYGLFCFSRLPDTEQVRDVMLIEKAEMLEKQGYGCLRAAREVRAELRSGAPQ